MQQTPCGIRAYGKHENREILLMLFCPTFFFLSPFCTSFIPFETFFSIP